MSVMAVKPVVPVKLAKLAKPANWLNQLFLFPLGCGLFLRCFLAVALEILPDY